LKKKNADHLQSSPNGGTPSPYRKPSQQRQKVYEVEAPKPPVAKQAPPKQEKNDFDKLENKEVPRVLSNQSISQPSKYANKFVQQEDEQLSAPSKQDSSDTERKGVSADIENFASRYQTSNKKSIMSGENSMNEHADQLNVNQQYSSIGPKIDINHNRK